MTRVTGFLVILGDAGVGQTLTARTNGIADSAGISDNGQRFEWLRDGSPIPGATGARYRVAPADAGHGIAVRWHYRDGAGAGKHVTSQPKRVPDRVADAMAAIYTLLFDRTPDADGAAFYAKHLRAGVALSALVADMERNRAGGAR